MKYLAIMMVVLTTGCASFGDRVTEARVAGQKCQGKVTLVAVQIDKDNERIELVCEWEA